MKVWVCRDTDGTYALFTDKCNPNLRATIDSNMRNKFFCDCGNDHRLIEDLCPKSFKRFTGLKRHLKIETKKLMNWKKPLKEKDTGET